MDDVAKYKSIMQKINKLERTVDSLDAKVELLIHSVNGLYEDLYEEDDILEDEVDSTEEETAPENDAKESLTSEETSSLADLILAIVEAIGKPKE